MIRLSDVKPILRSRGFRPRSALGQNFLSDPNALRFIAESAGATPRDLILEGKQRVAGEILEQIPDPPQTDGSIIHVSNLPYSVAVPIVIGLLEQEERIRRNSHRVQGGPGH